MAKLEQLTMSIMKRTAIKRGPTSSDEINDTRDEIIRDATVMTTQWNDTLVPLLDLLPDGTGPSPVDAVVDGLDGQTMYVLSTAVDPNDDGTNLYHNLAGRPNTLKEQYDAVYTEITSQVNTLRTEVETLTGSISQAEKIALGANIFGLGTSSPGSLEGRVDALDLNNKAGTQATPGAVTTFDVTFGTPFTDTNYSIALTGNEDTNVFWTLKLTTGVTIKVLSAMTAGGVVDWQAKKY